MQDVTGALSSLLAQLWTQSASHEQDLAVVRALAESQEHDLAGVRTLAEGAAAKAGEAAETIATLEAAAADALPGVPLRDVGTALATVAAAVEGAALGSHAAAEHAQTHAAAAALAAVEAVGSALAAESSARDAAAQAAHAAGPVAVALVAQVRVCPRGQVVVPLHR